MDTVGTDFDSNQNEKRNPSTKQQQSPTSQQQAIKRAQQQQQQPDYLPQLNGMTPSIITTINNTSPHPPEEYYPSLNTSNTCNTLTRTRRTTEPYESYIEDSFVGHWEREDDDLIVGDGRDEYGLDGQRIRHGNQDANDDDEDSALQHASTIEFDFDSFGPESIIYTPPANTSSADQTSQSLHNKSQSSPTRSETTPTPTATTLEQASINSPIIIEKQQKSEIEGSQAQDSNCKEITKQENVFQQGSSSLPETEQLDPTKLTQIATSTSTFNETTNQLDITRLPTDGDRGALNREMTLNTYLVVDSAQIDLKVIEPYKKVISHAGYCHHFDSSVRPPNSGEPAPAVIVFSACYLPDRSRRDYNYVMDHLFLYVVNSLHELIADDYILIYLHNTQPSSTTLTSMITNSQVLTGSGGSSSSSGITSSNDDSSHHPHSNNLPTFTWMKRCYQMIDRKLRKNLKILYLVKPTFWLKTIVIMCKPFISSKFSRKLRFIENMEELKKCLPVDRLILPASADNI